MSTWNIDPAHTEIGFKVKHLMVSTVKGFFGKFEGKLTADDDAFTNAVATFEADVASISTNNAQRDGHLQSGDFFDTAKFPKLSFVSTSFAKKEGNEYAITGNFTMKGVTKEITVKAVFNGTGKAMDDKRIASFDVTGVINRADYGVSWNAAIEAGGVAVSNEVWLDATLELKEA